MAHFRATIQGQRGVASRLGSRSSGIAAIVNGWNLGIKVEGENPNGALDVFRVYLTSGSNNNGSRVLLGVFTREEYEKLLKKQEERHV